MRAPIILLSPILLLLSTMAHSDSLRCDGELLSTGDRMFRVRELCGEPDVRVVKSALDVGYPGAIAYEEEWQYNFGPQRQLRFVDFVNKELRRVSTGPSGFSSASADCDAQALDEGISQLELQGRCGSPDRKARRVTARPFRLQPMGLLYPRGVPATDWIYRFEGNRFTRVVTLIDGWVVRVRAREKRD
jgi:hypothetical protein